MVERTDPMGVAAVWQQAADKIAALAGDDRPGPWNAAVAEAVAVLAKEAAEVRAMNQMAYLLIVGNVR